MQDRIEIELNKVIALATNLEIILEELNNEHELQKVFYAPVLNMVLGGSTFLKQNLNVILIRYAQRKAAGKTD